MSYISLHLDNKNTVIEQMLQTNNTRRGLNNNKQQHSHALTQNRPDVLKIHLKDFCHSYNNILVALIQRKVINKKSKTFDHLWIPF